MVETLLIGILALIMNMESFLGYGQFSRPIVVGPLVGLILGDFQTGLLVGASLELAFMGNITIGGALPPDIIAGGILGTAFAITTNTGIEGALVLALPIATLSLLFKNVMYIFARGYLSHRADAYADQGDDKGVARMHVVANLIYTIPIAIITALTFKFGGEVVQSILAAIPAFVMKGLSVATGLLPALGFAMITKMIMNKKVAPYFYIGFCLSAYLNIPVLGIAVFATLIALLVINNTKDEPVLAGGNKDEEF